MQQTICDNCGAVIPKDQSNRIETVCSTSNTRKKVTVMASIHNEDRDTDLCKHCIIDAINKLDDRERICAGP